MLGNQHELSKFIKKHPFTKVYPKMEIWNLIDEHLGKANWIKKDD